MSRLVQIAIGLGSNLGDRKKNLESAIQRLREEFPMEFRCSEIVESKPWGYLDQPNFLNAVVTAETDWKAPAIINYLKITEKELGRTTEVRNGPRLIDLDLLLCDSQLWSQEGVRIPHPRLQDRDFVLVPLKELLPNWKHPELKKTTTELLQELESKAHTILPMSS